jgi:hypothetical protein
MNMDKLKDPLLAKSVLDIVPVETGSDQIIAKIDCH